MLPSWLTHWLTPTLAPRPRRDRRARRRLALEHLEDRTVPSHTNPNASPTVGVYDENVIDPNTVDFVAAGSSFTDAEFASRVATAFNENRGGVIDGSTLGAFYRFGVDHPKVLRLGLADGTNWGIGTGHHISGTGGFASTGDGGHDFTSFNFVEIDGGAPDEHVVAFGVTALSISGAPIASPTRPTTASSATGSGRAGPTSTRPPRPTSRPTRTSTTASPSASFSRGSAATSGSWTSPPRSRHCWPRARTRTRCGFPSRTRTGRGWMSGATAAATTCSSGNSRSSTSSTGRTTRSTASPPGSSSRG